MIKELQEIDFKIFKPSDLKIGTIEKDHDNVDYCGVSIWFENFKMKFRMAKITPKKTGQFVTLWKKNFAHKNEPYHLDDDFDYFIIATKEHQRFGFFFFPKQVLVKHSILSSDNKVGKMGFRVYPVWDNPTNKQAARTQQWQGKYFVDFADTDQHYLDKFKSILM